MLLFVELVEGFMVVEFEVWIVVFCEVMCFCGKIEFDEELLGDVVVFGGVLKYVVCVKCVMFVWVVVEDVFVCS